MIPISRPSISSVDIESVQATLSQGWISSNSPQVPLFETELARYFSVPEGHVLATSNGTTAIELFLRTLDLDIGSKVVVPDITFAATINAVLSVGLTPVLLTNTENFCYSTEELSEVCATQNIGCVIFVNLYGCDCIPIDQASLLSSLGIPTLCDSAETFDALPCATHPGLKADAFTLSFFANKTISTGEGGALIFRDAGHIQSARTIRDHGMSSTHRYWHLLPGMNCRMTALQASLGIAQLGRVLSFSRRRWEILERYTLNLSSSPYFSTLRPPNLVSVWLVNIVTTVSDNSLLFKLHTFLKSHQVDTRLSFFPLSAMPIYSLYASPPSTPNSPDNLQNDHILLSLPTFVDLTNDEIDSICSMICSFSLD